MSLDEPGFNGSEDLQSNKACALTVVQYSRLSLRVIFLDSMNGCTAVPSRAHIEPHYDGGRIADYFGQTAHTFSNISCRVGS